MNSSISISEPAAWRRHLRRYLLALGLAAGLLLAGLLALDPYDSGRFALVPTVGVPAFGPTDRPTVAKPGSFSFWLA